MGSDNHSDFMLFVGAAEWTRDPEAQGEDADMYVEVSVDGSRQVHRTMYTKTAVWDENLKITGCLSSIIGIAIKSASCAHHSSESFSIARAEMSLGNLLETCVDDDLAALELTIAPLVSGLIDQVTVTDGRKGSEHTVPGTCADPPQQAGKLQRRITDDIEAQGRIDDDIEPMAGNISTCAAICSIRFERLGDLADLESAITQYQQALALTLEGNPKKLLLLFSLGVSYKTRFSRLGDLADLDNSISSQQEAVVLAPDDYPNKPRYLSNLGSSYIKRFWRLGDLADIENSILSQQEAVARTPDGDPDKPERLSGLGISRNTRFSRLGDLSDLENSILSQQEAVARTSDGDPDKPERLSNLGTSYTRRFERLGDLADIENSIARFQEAVTLAPGGYPKKVNYISNLGVGYYTRFGRLGDFADLENSISSQQEAVVLAPDDHPNKPMYISNLGISYHRRFEHLGDLADLENSIASFQEGVTLTPDGHPAKVARVGNLGSGYQTRFSRLGDLADLENSIAAFQEAIVLAPDDHRDKPSHLTNLGAGYFARFNRLGDLADLECAIARCQEAATLTPNGHPDKVGHLIDLGVGHWAGYRRYHKESYLFSALSSMKLAAQSLEGHPRDLLRASRDWAQLSLVSGDIPSALQAFRTAIETLPQVAWMGLDIASRQDWFTKEEPEELGCMAATCAIWLGRFEEAVELLDMARSVFWQQASSVRSDLQDLKAEHAALAEELETVSKGLDTSSFSGLSAASSDTQLYDRRLAEHRRLVLRRESLIQEIRLLSGFEFFLKPKPFNRLREAAPAGRVVIINISQLGADALVFDYNNPIHHLPLSKVDVANSFKCADDIQLKKTRDDSDMEDWQRSLTLPEVQHRR